MDEHNIGKVENRMGNNHKNCEVLALTTETQDKETVRVFRLLYDISLANNEVFDPLSLFNEETENWLKLVTFLAYKKIIGWKYRIITKS